MNKKKKQQSSPLRQTQERPTHIKRKLKESEEKCHTLQGDYKKLYESFSNIESKLKESEEKYQKLYEENEKTKEKLSRLESKEDVEKYLKNEAYSFLLAEGSLDKFLDFRETFHRTKAQEALYNLVIEADLGGLWIDI